MSSRILFPWSFAFPSDKVGREGVSRLPAKSGDFPARPSRNPIPEGRARSSDSTPDGPTAFPLPLQGAFPREAQKASPAPRRTRKVRRKVQQPRCTPPAPGDRTPPAPLFPPRDAAARRKKSLRAAQDRIKPGEGAEKAPLEVSMTRRDFRRESARKTPQLPSWRKRPVPPSSQDPTPIRFGPRGLQFLLFPLRP